MSVADDLTRIQGAKADLKTAIEAKGVTVPSSALIDDYPDYVDAIQQGSTPSLQNKTVSPTTSQQSVTADSGYDGLGTVTVNAIKTETKTATPSTSQQTINATSGKYMTQVTVSAVTSSIDANITAGNIKKDVSILGVAGTYEGSGGGSTLVPTAGDYPVVQDASMKRIASTSYVRTDVSITIPISGTYRLKWCAFRNTTSGTSGTRCYRNGSAIGTAQTTFQESYWQVCTLDIKLNAGDVIELYARSRATNYYCCAGMLSACVAQKLWTN